MVSAEIVGFDHGRVAPVRTREAHLPAARRPGESRRNREAFLRGRGELSRRVRCGDRELLEYERDVDGVVVHSTRQIDLSFNSVAVRRAIDGLSFVSIDQPRDENVVVQVLSHAAQIRDGGDAYLEQLGRITNARQHQ